jgi:hypothetical protein
MSEPTLAEAWREALAWREARGITQAGPPPSHVAMKRHPEGFTPSRVPMHGEGPTGWWSGLGHQLTCDRCGRSWAKRYAADARIAASSHECPEAAS